MDRRIVKHDRHADLDLIHLILDAVLVKEDVEHISLLQIDVILSNLCICISQPIEV